MSASDSESSTKDRRVNEIVADYLRSIERGELPDRAALIAGHVDLANELTAFFADHDRFWRAAAPLADALTLPPCESPEPGPRHTVRYFGDYELLEEIARGGMGVVYKARQISLNRPVALKMILAGELATPEARHRFRAEAEAAANLQHPNIVAIHEVGEHEGKQYFSMDLVVGKNLAEIVRGNPLPADRAASYVKTIAEAIHFAHQRGTLHRDLKPQNVLIDADDRPRITDFGLAKRVEADSSGLTRTGDVLGSPSYMPPEQAASQSAEIGPHSDVYSLGAILYELLTGRPPFAAATPWETICQVLQTPPVSPRKLNPVVPRDLETICLKCLEKQPQRRYHSARELAEELGRFLNHEPIHARPISLARRATFWARRHPWAITGVASLFVIGLVLVSFGLWEETRYLIWLQTHADYVRAPGPYIERLEVADGIAPWFFFLTFVVLLSRHPWAKRSLWQRSEPFADLVSPPQPLSRRRKLALALLGGIGTICGFIVLAMIAQAYVWEGRRVAGDLSLIYLLFWSSISALLAVARDVKGNAYGSSARALSPEDENAIREAVIAGEMIGAIKMYRDAVGASLPEAKAYVGRVVREHEDKHPGELAVKVFARARVQPKRLIVGLLVEASILGAMLWLLPAPERPRWLVEFIVSCSLGLAFIVAMRRFAGFGRPLVFAAPWPILMVAEVMSRVLYPEHYTFGAFMSGFGAGVLLFVSAIARMPIAQPTAASEASEKRGRM